MTLRAAGVATVVAVLVSACGSSVSESPISLPVSSDSGAIASSDACPDGPPARGPLANGHYGGDGVVGTITNETGYPVWVSNDAPGPSSKIEDEVRRTPCMLEHGKRAAYAGSEGVILYVSATASNRKGSRIRFYDPLMELPFTVVTGFTEPIPRQLAKSCGVDSSDVVYLWEDERTDFRTVNGEGFTGRVLIKRLPDDEGAATEYTGRSGSTSDWARIDAVIYQLGYCS